ncbi:ABC transporter ATP-binding protein [soil metagenome]
MTDPLLEVRDLSVRFPSGVEAVRGMSLTLDRGESLAVVGESGAGKSTLAHCIMGLRQPPEVSGSVRLTGVEMIGASEASLRSLRWSTVAIVPQSAAFNPVARIADQIAEPLREHRGLGASEARRRAKELADEALLPPFLLDRYPHELSGGQRRHALVAMALSLDPALLILDEPMAGVDQAGGVALIERIAQLARSRGLALLIVSHDIPAAMGLATRGIIMYAGQAIETGDARVIFDRPAHPYTRALVNAYPVMTTTKDLRPIRGRSPDPRAVPGGCSFHPRCTQAEEICREVRPLLEPARGRLVACHLGGVRTLLSATDIRKTYDGSGKLPVRALDAVSLTVEEGEAVGVVGRSGSGKTSLALVLAGHITADSGEVILQGAVLPRSWSRKDRALRRRIQLVMQDPWDALSPRLVVDDLVREALDIAREEDSADRVVAEMMEAVGLPASGAFLQARVHELSGGELQRVALARALAARPKVLVADEPTSMLDASEQARLIVVLRDLQVERGLGLVLISHDMAVTRKITDRIYVLEQGRVVEEGRSEMVSGTPRSEAARRLVDAAPSMLRTSGETPAVTEPERS